jgi:hypothetical protein
MINISKIAVIMIAFLAITTTSCKKDNFDEPPFETVDPNLPVTHTIEDLKLLFSGTNLKLTDDIIISGIVVANDKSGNIFNQIIIDDGSAGISVAIDQNALNGEFPVGRKIYVKCKDLILAADNALIGLYGGIDLTGSTVEIPSTLITKYIVKANAGNPVVPIDVADIDDLNNSFQNRLVRLSNVEFSASDANQPFADAVNKSSISRILKECDNDEIEVRSSGYADFAAKLTPKGKGSIIGVYTVYRTDKQLILRDGAETDMNGIKCDGSDPNALVLIEENFNAVTASSNAVLSLVNWQNINEIGGNKFKVAKFGSVICTKADVFSISNGSSSTQWLISPAINLNASSAEKLSFTSAAGFDNGAATLQAFISTDYDGTSTSPQTFTWTALPASIATGPGSGFGSFISSGQIDISAYSGTVFIAFKYVATAPATTYEIDDIKVTGLP